MSLLTFFFFSTALLSVTCLAFMLGYRFWELKAGKVEIPRRSFRTLMHVLIIIEKQKLEKTWSALKAYADKALHTLSEQAEKFTASGHYKKAVDVLRGKHIPLLGKSSSSPFFKAMLDYKEEMRRGDKK